jgi:hypothetical protein
MNYLDLELNDSNNYLSFYDDSLSIYKEYKTVRREININTLLEDKNIQFDISDMVTSKNLNGFVIE